MGKRLEKTQDIPNGQKANKTLLNSLIIREMYYNKKTVPLKW